MTCTSECNNMDITHRTRSSTRNESRKSQKPTTDMEDVVGMNKLSESPDQKLVADLNGEDVIFPTILTMLVTVTSLTTVKFLVTRCFRCSFSHYHKTRDPKWIQGTNRSPPEQWSTCTKMQVNHRRKRN